MKKLMLLALPAVMACGQKEKFAAGPAAPTAGEVVINEAVAGESQEVNEFGQRSDWFEIHNPGPAISLKAGEWFVTDDLEEPLKYELPAMVLAENGFVVIWCDGMDVVQNDVHTNFAIDAEGETLAITALADGHAVAIDRREVSSAATQGYSEGCVPDGTSAWKRLALPTPGGPNEEEVGEEQ